MIGSAVCDALLARGDEVVGLTRDPAGARPTNPTVSWHAWHPATERPPAEAFDGVDAVLNLIGENINQRLTPAAKERIHDSRVRATKNLVDGMAAVERTPGVLVSQCAVGYYGDHGEAIVDESTPADDSWTARLCADWEAAAMEAGSGGGVRVAVFRSAPVLDTAGGLLKQLRLPFSLGLGGPLAGGRQYMPWIHRDDEVALFLWALDNDGVSGSLNATTPSPTTNREFTRALGAALHRPAVIPVPRAALVAMRGEELTDQILGSIRIVPRRPLDAGFGFRFPEVEPALRDLLAG
jgi:uncharacterized protein (TIGR01777 family)